jgi:hypothetical protein
VAIPAGQTYSTSSRATAWASTATITATGYVVSGSPAVFTVDRSRPPVFYPTTLYTIAPAW